MSIFVKWAIVEGTILKYEEFQGKDLQRLLGKSER